MSQWRGRCEKEEAHVVTRGLHKDGSRKVRSGHAHAENVLHGVNEAPICSTHDEPQHYRIDGTIFGVNEHKVIV